MGWWGTDVLSGDSPLDELAAIAHIMGLEFDSDQKSGLGGYLDSYAFTKFEVEKHFDRLVAGANVDDWDGQITLQVLGVIAMAVGALIVPAKMEKILEAVVKDKWALEGDEERVRSMEKFRDKLKNYQGDAAADDSQTLFGAKSEFA